MSSSKDEQYSYEHIESIANFLLSKTEHRPTIGIICGSGLGSLADLIGGSKEFQYKDIPDFPVSTAPAVAEESRFKRPQARRCFSDLDFVCHFEGPYSPPERLVSPVPPDKYGVMGAG
ncbi:hypothetical protein MRX96_046462 [Rhipicephalus microplus]